MKMTQEQKLLTYLKGHKGVNRYQAMQNLHILNLPEVVRKLRSHGHDIESVTMKKNGEHWTEYCLR